MNNHHADNASNATGIGVGASAARLSDSRQPSDDAALTHLRHDLAARSTVEQVYERRREFQTWLRQQFTQLGTLPPDHKRAAGAALNRTKLEAERLIAERLRALHAAQEHAGSVLDPRLPVPPLRLGRVHPTTAVLRQLNAFFGALGFDVVDGPEIETDRYNFTGLNLPPEHPAREMHDTIYVRAPGLLLRTHTSSVEVRVMEQRPPPIRVVVPGKAYRYEAVNATNNYLFFQYEGLVVERGIHLGHLRAVLTSVLHYLFGPQVTMRMRAKYYPQVEPGLGVDLQCQFCTGAGCSVCKGKGWIEILGGGMVHPTIFAQLGIDWSDYAGFAFGIGLDRLVMSAAGIDDIRQLYGPRMGYLPEV